ncbi:MAG: putative molybdenum carrier protein [Gammaproteobacteria bacterium]|nr:putative molybdenum carrier protein [Gammaproteobacteria bacterium]
MAASDRTYFLRKIISGGQTGVDRAALDAALDNHFPCGGYCPRGRRAEDGVIHARYPLREHASDNYADRTRENVLQSDGTLIIYAHKLKGGTALTAGFCEQYDRPLMLVNAHLDRIEPVTAGALDFFQKFKVCSLNVAGPRKSQWAHGYQYTYRYIDGIIKACL